jgi:hypothetical protein
MNQEATVAKLLEAWQDGGISEAEEAELLQLLDEDAELRRCFAEQVMLIGAVRAAAEENPRWLALFDLMENRGDSAGTKLLSFEDAMMERISPTKPGRWYRSSVTLAVAAAVALLLAGSFFLKPRWSGDSDKAVLVPADPQIAAVAVVIGASPGTGQDTGTFLRPGLISQNEGWLTLQTLNGVSVTLDAPFRAEILNYDRIRLDEGMARVHVPEGAEGFRLDSPAFDVVDLGTEFAAKVNADGTGTCRVFDGKADVSLLDSIGEVKRTQRLTANESVRVNPAKEDMRKIQENNGDYPEIKQPPRPRLALPSTYAAELMAMGPSGYWRFEEILNKEVPDEVPGGARLLASGSAAIASESGGNHSGELTKRWQTEFFQIPNRNVPMLQGDFSISMFAQFNWLQNFALISAMRHDKRSQGNAFILQSYAAFRRSGQSGTGLHAVLRDPPAWEGGVEVFGNTLLRPLHWYHIVANRKGDQLSLYLDGTMVGSETIGTMPVDYRQIFVGRLNGNASQSRMEARGLVGHIDELAIFPRALSDEEILKLALTAK